MLWFEGLSNSFIGLLPRLRRQSPRQGSLWKGSTRDQKSWCSKSSFTFWVTTFGCRTLPREHSWTSRDSRYFSRTNRGTWKTWQCWFLERIQFVPAASIPPALRILGNWATEPWWAMTKLLAQGSEAGPCVAQLWSSWISRGRISKSSIKDQVGAKCGLKKTIYSECTEHFSNLFSSKLQSRNSIVFCVFCSFSCHLLSLTRSILGWRLGCGGPEDWSLGFLSPQGLASTAKTSARSLWPKSRRPLAYDWRCLWIFEAWSHGLNDSAIDIFRRL